MTLHYTMKQWSSSSYYWQETLLRGLISFIRIDRRLRVRCQSETVNNLCFCDMWNQLIERKSHTAWFNHSVAPSRQHYKNIQSIAVTFTNVYHTRFNSTNRTQTCAFSPPRSSSHFSSPLPSQPPCLTMEVNLMLLPSSLIDEILNLRRLC